jgi:transcriptional regulator with XRE-family HTH domain
MGEGGGQVETTPAVALGRALRRLREAAGLTQQQLAETVLSSKTTISSIENGNLIPKVDLLERLEAALNAGGALLDLWDLTSLGLQTSVIVADTEQGAISITDWEMRNVPGLLQTPDYMRAHMRAWRFAPDRIEEEISIRLGRQKIITSAELVTGWFVIDESVLYRPYGGQEAMRAQLMHLEEVAELPNVFLQVMPFTVTEHPGTVGPLRVLEYRDKPPKWFTEGVYSGRLSDDREEVADVARKLNIIRACGLSPLSSVDFIREIRSARYV